MRNKIIGVIVALFLLSSNAFSALSSSLATDIRVMVENNKGGLSKIKSSIDVVVADPRLVDQAIKSMLQDSKVVISKIVEEGDTSDIYKLRVLAAWMKAQEDEKHVLRDSNQATTDYQQFVLANPLASGSVFVASFAASVLEVYREADRENTPNDNLSALLELYFDHSNLFESRSYIAHQFLVFCPLWMQSKFASLTNGQKKLFFEDVKKHHDRLALGETLPVPDYKPEPVLTPAQATAYETAYQYVLANTPP